MQLWLQTGSPQKRSLDHKDNLTAETTVDDSDHSSIPGVSTTPTSCKWRKAVRKYDFGYINWIQLEQDGWAAQAPMCGMWWYFEQWEQIKQHLTTKRTCTPVTKAQEALYHTSLCIAKADKPHTIGEQLCLPSAIEMKPDGTWCAVDSLQHPSQGPGGEEDA